MKSSVFIPVVIVLGVLFISCSIDYDDREPQKTAVIEGAYTDSLMITDYSVVLSAPIIINTVLIKQLRRVNDSTYRMCAGNCAPPIYAGVMDSLDIIIRPDNSVRSRFPNLPSVPVNNQGSYYDPFIQHFYIKTEFLNATGGSHIIIDRLRKI